MLKYNFSNISVYPWTAFKAFSGHMNKVLKIRRARAYLLLIVQIVGIFSFLLSVPAICDAREEIKIGVPAYRGCDEALKRWSTAAYLNDKIPAPLDYHPVHELMSELGIRPYKDFGKVTLADIFRRYWHIILLTFAGFIITMITAIYALKLNQRLRQSKQNLEKTNAELENKNTELGIIEEKVRQQNEFMRIVIDSIPNPFYVIDASDYTIKLANKALNPHNLKPDSKCYAVTHKTDAPCGGKDHPCTLLEVKRTKESVTFEHNHYDNSGAERVYEVHGYPIFDSKGDVVQVIEHSVDINKRKQAEEQLLKLYQALEQSPSSVMITDVDGRIEYVNLKFIETTGYSRSEALGKSPSILKSGKTHPGVYHDLWNTVKSGREWYGELINKKKDGAIFWENASISPVRNAEGSVTNFVAFKEDITERKMLEERFRQTLSEHQIILENASIGIALLKERKIMQINRKFEDLFGYQRHEILGRTTEILYKDDKTYMQIGEEKYKVFSSGKGYSTELMMKHRDNSLFWCRLFGKAIDPEDMSKGSIWLFEDISEQKSSELKLKQQQHQLLELNNNLEKIVAEEVAKNLAKDHIMIKQAHLADLGVLAAGITHEINTPLTYIKGNLELLKMEIGTGPEGQVNEANELFGEIEDGIVRITGIIESMKELSGCSKKEKATENLFRTIIYSNRIVHNRAKHISNIYINGKQFDMKMDRDAEVFTADIAAQRIEQVWVIILNNALDEFLKSNRPFEERYIKISVLKDCDKIQVLFRDNAGGIPEDIIGKVFDLFASTKTQSGTGIGLNVAKTIIEDHNGTIKAYNDDYGAVFECNLNLKSNGGDYVFQEK